MVLREVVDEAVVAVHLSRFTFLVFLNLTLDHRWWRARWWWFPVARPRRRGWRSWRSSRRTWCRKGGRARRQGWGQGHPRATPTPGHIHRQRQGSFVGHEKPRPWGERVWGEADHDRGRGGGYQGGVSGVESVPE